MADITCKELLILQDSGKSKLRVVSWNNGEPKLERRHFYEKDGVERVGKATGLDLEDVLIIIERQDEITKVMGIIEPEKKGGSKGGRKKGKQKRA